jgi:hypothetical protein
VISLISSAGAYGGVIVDHKTGLFEDRVYDFGGLIAIFIRHIDIHEDDFELGTTKISFKPFFNDFYGEIS